MNRPLCALLGLAIGTALGLFLRPVPPRPARAPVDLGAGVHVVPREEPAPPHERLRSESPEDESPGAESKPETSVEPTREAPQTVVERAFTRTSEIGDIGWTRGQDTIMFGSLCKLFERDQAARLVVLYWELQDYMQKTGHGLEEQYLAARIPLPPKLPHALDEKIAKAGGDPVSYGREALKEIVGGDEGYKKLMWACEPPSDENNRMPDTNLIGWNRYR